MRAAAAVVVGLLFSATTFGAEGAPSEQVLADMGLGGMQVLSDTEAMAVRGAGFDGFKSFHDSIKLFHKQVKDFHRDVKDFHRHVKKFDRKMGKMKHHKPNGMRPPKNGMKPPMNGMKPPKMSHGGKLW